MTASLTPAQAWDHLLRGNERFITGEPEHPRQDAERREELAHRQHPIVTVFGCSDSRLAAEIIFDLGLGDSFVIRNAGQVVTSSVLGSLEYAVHVLHTPLILVLGHDECGAVRAAIDSLAADPPTLPAHIATLIGPVIPAAQHVAGIAAGEHADPAAVDAQRVGREHLRTTVAEIVRDSEVISGAIAQGSLAIVAANYRLRSGRVAPDTVVGVV